MMPFLSGMPGLQGNFQAPVGQPGVNPSAIQFMDLMMNMPGGSPFGGQVPNFGTPFSFGVPHMLPETTPRVPPPVPPPVPGNGPVGDLASNGRGFTGSER